MPAFPPHIFTKQAPNNAGNGLFSSQAIDACTEIFRIDRPLVSVLDSRHLKDACSNCYVWVPDHGMGQMGGEQGRDVKLRACQGCKISRYCTKGCQAQSWKNSHRFECKTFTKLYPKVLPNTVRMVMQLLLGRQAKSLPDAEWQDFLELQSHLNDFRSSYTKNAESLTTWQTIELMSQAALTYSGSREPLALIQTLTARVLINTLTLTTPTLDPLGLCLSPLSSLINHSCKPNTVGVYAGATLVLRSLAPIPACTELSISYIDTTNATSTRQSELQSRYFFTCTCPSCEANSTNGLPDPAPDPAFEALGVRAIELQNDAATKPAEEAALFLKTALSLFASHPPCRQPYPTILHTAFLNSISTQSWPRALGYALRAYFHIDPVHYPLVWHPVRVVRKWVLLRCVVQIAALVVEGDASVKVLETFRIDWQVVAIGLAREVQGGVQLSHGVGSPFAGEVETFVGVLGSEGRDVDGEVLEEVWRRLRKVADADPS